MPKYYANITVEIDAKDGEEGYYKAQELGEVHCFATTKEDLS